MSSIKYNNWLLRRQLSKQLLSKLCKCWTPISTQLSLHVFGQINVPNHFFSKNYFLSYPLTIIGIFLPLSPFQNLYIFKADNFSNIFAFLYWRLFGGKNKLWNKTLVYIQARCYSVLPCALAVGSLGPSISQTLTSRVLHVVCILLVRNSHVSPEKRSWNRIHFFTLNACACQMQAWATSSIPVALPQVCEVGDDCWKDPNSG